MADHLAEVFSLLDPTNAADYAANAKAFDQKMEASLAKWKQQMAPYQGAPVVTYHKNFVYFANRFGLKQFGTVEPKPGIPPSPKYLSDLADRMKTEGVKVVLYQAYYNPDPCNQLAKRAGGVAVKVATECGGVPGTDDVFSKFEALVSSITGALSGKAGGAR